MFSSVGHGSAFDIAGRGIRRSEPVLRCNPPVAGAADLGDGLSHDFSVSIRTPISAFASVEGETCSMPPSALVIRCRIRAARASVHLRRRATRRRGAASGQSGFLRVRRTRRAVPEHPTSDV